MLARRGGPDNARRPAVDSSRDHTIGDHLEEYTARRHLDTVIVSPIHSAKLPAAAAVVEALKEAVPRASPRMRLNGVAAVLLEQPDRLQVTLPAIGWFHITTCDEPLGSLKRSKAHRASIRGVVRDLVSRLHQDTLRVYRKKGKEFRESPISRARPRLHLLNIRNEIHSSTVK